MYVHDLSGRDQVILGLAPDLLLECKHALEVVGIGARLQAGQVGWTLFGYCCKSLAPVDGILEFLDWHEPSSGLVIGVTIGRVLGFVCLCPVLLAIPEHDIHNFLIIAHVLDNILFKKLILGAKLIIDRLSYFPDLSPTVVTIPSVVCVLNAITVVRFLDYREY